MSILLTRLVLAAGFISVPMSGFAQNAARVRAPLSAQASPVRKALAAARLQGTAPTIDGRLDETAWSAAVPGTDFIQIKPTPGSAASQRTEARVLYDGDAIYVGVRAFDTHPDSIVGRLARRDQKVFSDWLFVAIDSYYDRRTAYAFGLNPKGVKVDVFLYDDTNDDENWDAIWDGAASVDSLGWVAEFRIPLSQLRFSAGLESGISQPERTWGLNLMRGIARLDEESFWAPLAPDAGTVVSAFGDLTGLQELRSPRKIEIMPYTVARLTRAPGDAANPFYQANAPAVALGGDLKFGLTSNLTLTATLNPDFGQVEADPSDVNLTAYETFFPEKRPFFVEGANIFRFGIGAGDGDFGNEALFYSRRIGRAPQGAVPGSAVYQDVPDGTTILGAGKLSGKTANGWSMGVLYALTAAERARFRTAQNIEQRELVEPLTNYAVARALREFRGGKSSVGGILTTVNRDLADDDLMFLRSAAYSGGVDARHRFLGDRYEIAGQLVGTHVRGDSSAIRRAQRSSARYFQRPDADHVEFDGTRTALSGLNFNLAAVRVGGSNWNYGVFTAARTPGFEANDLGFMRNSDDISGVWWLGYRSFTAGQTFRRWNISTNQWNSWSFGRERTGTGGNLNGGLQLLNYWTLGGGISREQQALSTGALRGGPALVRPGRTNGSLRVESDTRKPVSLNASVNLSREDESGGRSLSIGTGVSARPSTRADLRLSPALSWNRNPWQYLQRSTIGGSDRFLFGAIEQRTASITARLNYTFTPNLSLQLYAQPFIAAGSYDAFSRVADPRGPHFRDRFLTYDRARVQQLPAGDYTIDEDADGRADIRFDNPNFNVKQLRSNLVARWEYRPGSALYVVWSQGRSIADEFGSFDLSRDAGELFRAEATNVLLVKFSYWLGL